MPRKKKNQKPSFEFPHYVDESKKIVYVHVGTFMGSMAVHIQGPQIWPDYEIRVSSNDLVKHLLETND